MPFDLYCFTDVGKKYHSEKQENFLLLGFSFSFPPKSLFKDPGSEMQKQIFFAEDPVGL